MSRHNLREESARKGRAAPKCPICGREITDERHPVISTGTGQTEGGGSFYEETRRCLLADPFLYPGNL